MKKIHLPLISAILVVLLTIFSSCGDDEKEVAKVSFDTISQSVGEDEGEIFIPYQVQNGPIADNATLSFDFSGTATLDEDFELSGWDDDGVYLTLFNDNTVESDETIIVTIASGEKVDIGQTDTHTVTIEDNDFADLEIELTWDAGAGTPGDVDMDLILFKYDPVGDVFDFVEASDAVGTVFESLTLSSNEPEATYGLSYQYYSGSSDNLTFTATFTTTDGTLEGTEDELSFSETYTLDNVNPTLNVFIEQTFDQEGSDFNNFSTIDVPAVGSRVKSFKIPSIKQVKKSVTRSITLKKIGK